MNYENYIQMIFLKNGDFPKFICFFKHFLRKPPKLIKNCISKGLHNHTQL